MSQPVVIKLNGPAPLHQCGVSILSSKHPHSARVEAFLDAGWEEMEGRQLLEGDLDMELEYAGFYPMTDPVNVVFALSNMFEGIVYRDDNQIREVHCRELKVEGPVCVVRFSNLLPSSW